MGLIMATDPGTALVTGASSGIGVDFARELARRGFHVILTARRLDRLQEVQVMLQRQFGVDAFAVPSDLASAGGAARLFADVQRLGRPVTLLVNNAGFGRFGPFLDQDWEELEAMIRLNAAALTTLTRLFAAEMCAQGSGFILNNASFSGLQPVPDYAVYSATKAYVVAFSLALHNDLRRSHVRVSALCPGFFHSEFYERAGQEPARLFRWMMLQRRHVARAGIAGVLRGKAVIVPGVAYKALDVMGRLVPRAFGTVVARFLIHDEPVPPADTEQDS